MHKKNRKYNVKYKKKSTNRSCLLGFFKRRVTVTFYHIQLTLTRQILQNICGKKHFHRIL